MRPPCAGCRRVVTLRAVVERGTVSGGADGALARVIAMVNDKGGVGKTSIVANLAGQLAAADHRCLVIDLNRQADLADVLAPTAAPYDVVFVGCPPESPILTDLAPRAARWVVMSTKSDVGGLVGMRLVAERFAMARERNPELRLLGAVLFGTGTRSRRVHAEVRSAVAGVAGDYRDLGVELTLLRDAEDAVRAPGSPRDVEVV